MNIGKEYGRRLKGGLRVCMIGVAVYFFLTFMFRFLAGDQLMYRESRGNLGLPEAKASAVELTKDIVVEQHFSVKIQRLEAISVQWAAYYRTNVGTVTIELIDGRDGAELMSGRFDVSGIQEGQLLTIHSDALLEGLYDAPLILRIYADSVAGSAVAPLITNAPFEGMTLWLNGVEIPGMLCFSVSGTDYIWTGLHYWLFVAIGAAILALFFTAVLHRYVHGKHSYVVNALIAVKKYQFLIQQLVSRDFKTKYKRSVLGVFWSFLNPLLMMSVQYFVFSSVFQSDVQNFPAYLLLGVVVFNFFSEACGMSLTAILSNASLITKVYVPKYIYPLTRVMSSLVNLSISLIPLFCVCFATGVVFKKSIILSVYFLFCLVIFCLGLGLLLSSSMVFFRDTQFLWNVMNMVWMYATPIFYPETILPNNFRFILQINPLYHFLKNIRVCVLEGISPEPLVYFQCLMIAIAMLLVGSVIFWKNQDKFALCL